MSADGAAFGGLAPISTSGPQAQELEIDTGLNRWKKLRKAVRFSSFLHDQELDMARQRRHVVMVTLTYAGNGRSAQEGGDAEPRHISDYLSAVRKWSKRRGFALRYVWVGELQERGALHYHVAYWLPRHVTMPKADKQGWWKHGRTNLVSVKSSAVGYLTKYISKLRSKQRDGLSFPKGFRMHGAGGLSTDAREQRAYHLLAAWGRALGDWTLRFRRAVGGGLLSKVTGEWWSSPWQVSYVERRPGLSPLVHIRLKPQEC